MSSEFGNIIRVSVFGQSHGKAVGVVVDGLPAGEAIDLEELQRFLDRRRPGTGPLSTTRKETDVPEFLSGLEGGKTCGAPLCAVIKNADQHSKDYGELADKPRPGHADFTAWAKWGGHADMRGGGHFSGRLTAPLCVAGGIAKQILARRGIFVGAHLASVAGICDQPFPLYPTAALFSEIAAKPFPVLDEEAGERMRAAILEAKNEQDSVGGAIECGVFGLPAGAGSPDFGRNAEGIFSQYLFAVPAVKAVAFGAGTAFALMRGSEANDPLFVDDDGSIRAEQNCAGGINGGITNGMPLVFEATLRPTPSIGRRQFTVNLAARENAELELSGRHDPCVVHRAVPVLEAAAALAACELLGI